MNDIISTAASIPPSTAAACAELTGLQVAAGFVTWMNVLKVFAIAGVVVCFSYLVFRLFGNLLAIFRSIPLALYEAVGYALAAGLVLWSFGLEEGAGSWPRLGGCLLFGAMLLITSSIRNLKGSPAGLFAILAAAWGLVALVSGDPTIGFIAVAAGVWSLGFTAAVQPLTYVLGFRSEDAVARTTFAALVVLAAYVAARVWRLDMGAFSVFEAGALWVGGFVGFLGLLIVSSRWYGSGSTWVLRQIVTAGLGFAAIGIGNVFSIPQLSGIGGTFFVLWLVEKPFEIPHLSRTAYMAVGLVVFSVLGYGVWWAQNNMAVVEPYLLF